MKGTSNYFKIDNSYNLMEAQFKMLMPLRCKLSKQSCKPKENIHLRVSLHAPQGNTYLVTAKWQWC